MPNLTGYKPGDIKKCKIIKIAFHGLYLKSPEKFTIFVQRSEAVLTIKIVELSECFEIDQEVNVKIISFDKNYKYYLASIIQTIPDPWDQIHEKYKCGDIVTGEVVLTTANKATIEVENGIVGTLFRNHVWIKVDRIGQALLIGDKVKVKIIELNSNNKYILFSVSALFEKEENESKRTNSGFTLKDALFEKSSELIKDTLRLTIEDEYKLKEDAKNYFRQIVLIGMNKNVSKSLHKLLAKLGLKSIIRDSLNELATIIKDKEIDLCFYPIEQYNANTEEEKTQLRFLAQQFPIIIEGESKKISDAKSELDSFDLSKYQLQQPYNLSEIILLLENIAESKPLLIKKNERKSEKDKFVEYFLDIGESPFSEGVKLSDALEDLRLKSNAKLVAIFSMNLTTHETNIFKISDADSEISNEDQLLLRFTPLQQVIFAGIFWVDEVGIANGHYKYFQCFKPFKGVIGIRLNQKDENGYALFLFGKEDENFIHDIKSLVEISCALLSVEIQRSKFENVVQKLQRFIVAGKVTSGLIHELNTQKQAFTNLLGYLKLQSNDLKRGELKTNDYVFIKDFDDTVDTLQKLDNQSNAIQDTYLNILRGERIREIDLHSHFFDITKILDPVAKKKNISIKRDLQKVPITYINLSYLDQIIFNLFLNSIESILIIRKNTGEINIALFENENNVERPICVEISDNGPGIHLKYFDQIFDLSFTTKEGGTGIGLYICKNLCKAMKGHISVKESTRFGGTTFKLEFPLVTKEEILA
jgi:signal transduction histidine kinase/predicted RNA-binding protein with RPS1 domain